MKDLKKNSDQQKILSRSAGTSPALAKANDALAASRPNFAPGVAPLLNRRAANREARAHPLPGNGQWWESSLPFRHFTATDVFDVETYAEISRQFSLILEASTGEREGKYKMRRGSGNNDCLILGLTDSLAQSFPVLFTEAWLRSLSDILQLEFVPRVEGALHSNPGGSRTGWIHTDCCSAWFDESHAEPDRLMLPPRGRCSYFTGEPKVADAKPKEYIRAATMIFFLCNDRWEPGDGGETGIYSSERETEETTLKLIPPLNNSLLFFECSPHSYHRFVANPGGTRNSIILWLHSHVADAVAKWGTGINRRNYL